VDWQKCPQCNQRTTMSQLIQGGMCSDCGGDQFRATGETHGERQSHDQYSASVTTDGGVVEAPRHDTGTQTGSAVNRAALEALLKEADLVRALFDASPDALMSRLADALRALLADLATTEAEAFKAVEALIHRKQRLFEPNEGAYNALVQLAEEVDAYRARQSKDGRT
jgi:hypothetical protein